MKKILSTIVFLSISLFLYAQRHTDITIKFKNESTINYTVNNFIIHLAKSNDERSHPRVSCDDLPPLQNGEWMIGKGVFDIDCSNAIYQDILNLQALFTDNGYHTQVWHQVVHRLIHDEYEQAIYFQSADIKEITLKPTYY